MAINRLKKFIDEQEVRTRSLPLVHSTNAYCFADVVSDDFIRPEFCDHFQQNIVYLFYGRPAYRSENAEFTDLSFSWPIVFVFDPEKIKDIKAVFPFDTGAFFPKNV
jgi:hypothetical protein